MGVRFGRRRERRVVTARRPACPTPERHRPGGDEDRLLRFGTRDETGHAHGNGRVPSGSLRSEECRRDERRPVRVVDLHVEALGVRCHRREVSVGERREGTKPVAVPLPDEGHRVASRHGEEARRDAGGEEREDRPVGIPHEQLVATQDRHDIADHDRPGAGERVARQAGGVFFDDRGQRGRTGDSGDVAVGLDRWPGGSAQRRG